MDSNEFISLLEADKRAPSLTTLNEIAAYLKKDIHDFLQEKEGAFSILCFLPSAGEIRPSRISGMFVVGLLMILIC